jgi:hypothetical protein
VVELTPAILPALVDRGDEGVGVRRKYAFGGSPVCGELDAARGFELLESLGRELEEAGTELFGAVRVCGDGRADQVKMFRSFSKKPW